eukprot:194928-Prymnesium_polylepis.1
MGTLLLRAQCAPTCRCRTVIAGTLQLDSEVQAAPSLEITQEPDAFERHARHLGDNVPPQFDGKPIDDVHVVRLVLHQLLGVAHVLPCLNGRRVRTETRAER